MKDGTTIKLWLIKMIFISNHINRSVSVVAILTSCFLFILTSCEKYEMDDIEHTLNSETKKSVGVYPKASSQTRSVSNGFWESWSNLRLRTGEIVNTPWNSTSTESNVPHDILEDVKYVDGWELIFYLIDDTNYSGNSPYLIFHNRYTGILKVFYYLSNRSFHPNNHGVWQIDTDSRTSLFAFQSNPISKISEKKKATYYVSNITTNATHGFSVGWNCFQIELAYDPSQSGWMTISTLASNTVELSLTGNLSAETEGLIATSSGKNNYGSGVANIAGKEAGTWIQNKIKDKTILGIPSSIISEGIKAIVSGGVGSVINALTGLFKSDDTSKSVQLTTNGTFNIKGAATFETTTGITTLQINLDPSKIGYLGVWGLKEEPTLLFSPYAVFKSPQEYSNGYTREYMTNVVNSNASASIMINPDLNQHEVSKSASTSYFQSSNYTRMNIWGVTGKLGRDPKNTSKVYEDLYKANFNIIADIAFIGDENAHIPIDQFEPPMEVFIPNVPNGPQGAAPNFIYHSKYLASIGVKITLPDGSEAYSYHHCVPKIDWNYSEYNNGLYWSLYPCEPVRRTNTFNLNAQSREILEKYNTVLEK
ncbi:MAG: hypothetical protein NC453_16560 [Muribaculum sp.]|nr:hypothetical protein [Muribaculum sp.]